MIDAWHLRGVPHVGESFSIPCPLRLKRNKETLVATMRAGVD